MRRRITHFARGVLRRQKELFFPTAETRQYRAWMKRHLEKRKSVYDMHLEPGLLSVITPVWNGSPVRYLQQLAKSLADQNEDGACEWVVLDNGCSRPDLQACFQDLGKTTWIKVLRTEDNLGIIRGLRCCLEHACGRYILPTDGDDQLYPDALKIVTAHVQNLNYPALLYTDEDKVAGTGITQPYFKPDWDPVLLGNSAYIAHWGVIDRQEALRLGAYTDQATEGSPDWDLFTKFSIAGHSAAHIPEVVYSWRVHAQSTADDGGAKSYIASSQRAVLDQILKAKNASDRFALENSPLFTGADHWRFRRLPACPKPMTCFVLQQAWTATAIAAVEGYPAIGTVNLPLTSPLAMLAPLVAEAAERDELVCFLAQSLHIENKDWLWEALGIFELFPDTVMVGGRILDEAGIVLEAGQHLGFQNSCGSPDAGRKNSDPGYFGQIWKQRSVGAVSIQCAVVKAKFLSENLPEIPSGASLAFLGPWLGARALRTGKRVVYTPFLGGVSTVNWGDFISADERTLFASANRDILPDRRYYPAPFSMQQGFSVVDD